MFFQMSRFDSDAICRKRGYGWRNLQLHLITTMNSHILEIGYLLDGDDNNDFPPNLALWNGERRVQEKHTHAQKRFRDGADAVLLALADGFTASATPHLASGFVVDAIGALDPTLGIDSSTITNIQMQLRGRYAEGPIKNTSVKVLAACIQGNRCQVVNVGDHHAYLIDGDGNWTHMSPVPTEQEPTHTHCIETPFNPFDSLLLCSQSVHAALNDEQLQGIYKPRLAPACQADVWRRAVKEMGATVSLSIILARLKPRGCRHELKRDQA